MERQHIDAIQKSPSRKDSRDSSSLVSFPSMIAPRGIWPGNGVAVQAQLETTAPGDELEREADATADLVLRKIETGTAGAIPPPPSGHFRSSVSAYGGSSVSLPSQMESRMRSSLGGGQSLPGQVRSQMESAFGQSFSQINIHTDSAAAEMSRSIGAKAFTYGNDIFFNQGQFSPDSSSGRHLIAHELTHTLQQGGKVARRESTGTIRARLKKNAKNFPDANVWRVVIKDVLGVLDNDVIDCYFDALTRGPEWFTTFKGAWDEDLEAMGKSQYKHNVLRGLLDSNYYEKIAERHYFQIRRRIDSVHTVLVDRNGNRCSDEAQYRHKLFEVLANVKASGRSNWIIAVESAYLQYLEDQTYTYLRPFKAIGVADRQTYELAFGAMFALVALGVLAAVAAGAAGLGAAGTSAVSGTTGTAAAGATGGASGVIHTVGTGARFIAYMKTPKALITAGKDIFKAGYDYWMDSDSNKAGEYYLEKKFAELLVTLIVDELDAYYTSDWDSALKSAVKDVVIGVIVSCINNLIENGTDFDVEKLTADTAARLLMSLKNIKGIPSQFFDGAEEPLTQAVSSAVHAMYTMVANPLGKMEDVDPDSDLGKMIQKAESLEKSWQNYLALLISVRDRHASYLGSNDKYLY